MGTESKKASTVVSVVLDITELIPISYPEHRCCIQVSLYPTQNPDCIQIALYEHQTDRLGSSSGIGVPAQATATTLAIIPSITTTTTTATTTSLQKRS